MPNRTLLVLARDRKSACQMVHREKCEHPHDTHCHTHPPFHLVTDPIQLRGHNSTTAQLLMTEDAYRHPRFTELLYEARRRNLEPNAPAPDRDIERRRLKSGSDRRQSPRPESGRKDRRVASPGGSNRPL